jgi:drug/metabolite transporter (DMT)-like permease
VYWACRRSIHGDLHAVRRSGQLTGVLVVAAGVLALLLANTFLTMYYVKLCSKDRLHVVAAIVAVAPVVTALIVWRLYGATIGPIGWIGIAMVVAGIALTVSFSSFPDGNKKL